MNWKKKKSNSSWKAAQARENQPLELGKKVVIDNIGGDLISIEYKGDRIYVWEENAKHWGAIDFSNETISGQNAQSIKDFKDYFNEQLFGNLTDSCSMNDIERYFEAELRFSQTNPPVFEETTPEVDPTYKQAMSLKVEAAKSLFDHVMEDIYPRDPSTWTEEEKADYSRVMYMADTRLYKKLSDKWIDLMWGEE